MCFVGDDLFDVDLLKAVKYSFCPKNSLSDVKDCCMHVLLNEGGNNLIMELHDYLLCNNLIKKADLQSVMNLDALEKF